ncbi:HD-GYP domain-containing protein [Thalassotalea montiporae]
MADTDLQTILVVDDNPDNIDVLSGILRPQYKVKASVSGKLALRIAGGKQKPDLILLDIMMPEMDGYQVCEQLKANPITRDIPVIFVTAKSEAEDERRGFELGAVDYITKPVSMPIVLARIRTHLALYDQQRELAAQVKQRTEEIEETRHEIIKRLGRAAEYKDNETGMHVIRMSYYARFLAERIGAAPEWVELLFYAAPMHDIGKIGIPDHVLLKEGRLNEDEWRIMQKHVEYGADILGNHDSELLSLAREVALTHHEKWDGSGYPNGLKGEEIPLSGRIVAIADVFDALTSTRPYKKAWSDEEVITFLNEQAGKHFDPALVPEFLACMPQVLEIKAQFSDE